MIKNSSTFFSDVSKNIRKAQIRGVFRTQSNIYDGSFLQKQLTAFYFCKKKAPSLMFDWVLNTLLLIRIFEVLQRQVKKNWIQQIQYMKVWGRTGLTHLAKCYISHKNQSFVTVFYEKCNTKLKWYKKTRYWVRTVNGSNQKQRYGKTRSHIPVLLSF